MVELKKSIVLVGGGGHCISVIDIIENGNEFNILGILDSNSKENNLLGYKILGGDNLIPELVNENTYFLITVGQIKNYSIRKNIAKNLIENIRRFSKSNLKHEFPECYKIFINFKEPEILYIAAIFHDIAKGRGGDHSELGEKIAKRFVKTYNLTGEYEDIIPWLVKAHLSMSNTAQKKDLSDPVIIDNFANFVGSQRNLVIQ